MKRDPLEQVFEPLEPPPGGLAELRARLQGERPPRWPWLVAPSLAAAAAAALLLVGVPEQTAGAELADQWAASDPMLAAALGRERAEPVSVAAGHAGRLAVERVGMDDERVILYRLVGANAPLGAGQIRKVRVARD